MTDATELDEAAIRARVEAATEGPWRTRGRTPWGDAVVFNEAGEMFVGVRAFTAAPSGGWSAEARARAVDLGRKKCADAEFIAHARTDVPLLMAALNEARTEIQRERSAMGQWRRLAHQRDARATAAEAEVERLRAVVERVEALIPTANPELIEAGYAVLASDVLTALTTPEEPS